MTIPKTFLDAPDPGALRAEFVQMLHRDWLGPAGGEEETLPGKSNVRDRYLTGMLAPKKRANLTLSELVKEAQERAAAQAELEGESEPDFNIPPDEQGEIAIAGADDEQGRVDAPLPNPDDALAFVPNTMGLTVSLGADAKAVSVHVRYGRYERETTADGTEQWRRKPVHVSAGPIAVKDGLIGPYPVEPTRGTYITGICRRGHEGYAMTIMLVNGQTEPRQFRDTAWLFQPEITVMGADGKAVFAKRRFPRAKRDPETRTMQMLYREQAQFAVGHGVGVHVEGVVPGQPDRAKQVSTRFIPSAEVLQMGASGVPGLITDMKELSELKQGQFEAALSPLTEAYAAWLDGLDAKIANPDRLLQDYTNGDAQAQVQRGRRALARIRAGIALLESNLQAAQAFQFTNAAMRKQRIQSMAAERNRRKQPVDMAEIDIPQNRSWRPFQLAFILLNLPAMVDPAHPDRSAADPLESPVDLLWFPTGGGKTEAYLGLTAFTLAIRRLQKGLGGYEGEGAGVAVIMRYTLRLLTLQQFQRATALICACEVIRRENPDLWGSEPFRVGLWVGARSTPNYTQDSAEAVKEAKHNGYGYGNGTPLQLKHCPWCGNEISPSKNVYVETVSEGAGRTFQYCGDSYGECPFSHAQAPDEGLPILVVDEEIYRRLPALLIATVDKFAQMPWKGETQMLFGRVTGYCPRHGYRSPDLEDEDSHRKRGKYEACTTVALKRGLRPPDLIIQDELHLISGPLGTLVGLYETAVDALCEWTLNGVTIRPKIIASTATIRRATQQVRALFQRGLEIFPPAGLQADDNFFAQHRLDKPGRLYLGVCVSGARLKSVLIRVYTTAMAAAQKLREKYGSKAADPYMTLVGYFNSMRELGGMMRVIDDTVQSRLRKMGQMGLANRNIHNSNIDELTSRKSAIQIPETLDRLETPFTDSPSGNKSYPLDVVLATNMISVGVDVARLGCMVVAGQPKTTAEYIQATSRVGRQAPGVVITVYNWTRPRDLSHYETFEHYHKTFYQHVEALSVTPFAPRALDRALVAVFVALMRLKEIRMNKNDRAGSLTNEDALLGQIFSRIAERAGRVTNRGEVANHVERMLVELKNEWLGRIQRTGGRLTYSVKQGAFNKLLSTPQEHDGDRQLFTCLNSMRDVERPVRLTLDDFRMDDLS